MRRPLGNSERFKKFTILHSNDIHGDFLAEVRGDEGKLIGGLSLLSGYINQVRKEENNVFYLIAGDMLQGSIIDTAYKGISTIEIMNYLSPDVITLGNHELDYGLPQLLFLEKVANFPIVNANLYMKRYYKRLMRPYIVINKDGFDIMFIGIITEEVLNQIRADSSISTFISLEDACEEIGKICNAYKDEDIDLTVLLTHIGFEKDKKLAAMLKPEWGVDMIVGGHSHTIMDQPAQVNGILIAQAGIGSDQIGRFDIVVDDDTNSIVDWKWSLIEINDQTAKPDVELEKFIAEYKESTDKKFGTLICRLARKLTHPSRSCETELGNLFADILAFYAQSDVALLNGGSIRKIAVGPVLNLGELKSLYPYDDSVLRMRIRGSMLQHIFDYALAQECRPQRYLQISKGARLVFAEDKQKVVSFKLNDVAINGETEYTVCLTGYFFANSEKLLGIRKENIEEAGNVEVVSTSIRDLIEEYFRSHQNLDSKVEGRIVFS